MGIKKDEPSTIRLVRKANQLVEGKYRFDIWEMRVFTKMLTMIYRDDEDFKNYRIYLKDIISDFELEQDKESYTRLKLGAEKLTKREIRLILDTPEGEMELLTNLAIGAKSFRKETDGKFIEMTFHPDMKPFLLQLQTQFLMYDVRNILSIQSSFSIRIYELLKQYEKIGQRKFSVQELKEMLDVADKYPLYANFKQRVLLKAQQDLEIYTDISFSLQEIKKGKSVVELLFTINSNKAKRNLSDISHKKQNNDIEVGKGENNEAQAIFTLIKKYEGANISTVETWLKKYSSDYIKERIILVENMSTAGKKLTNAMGLLQTLMLQPNLFDPIQEDKNKKLAKQEKLQQEKFKKDQERDKEQTKKNILQQYEQAKKDFINNLFDEMPHLGKDILADLKAKRSEAKPSFMIQLAFDNYKKLENTTGASKEEILYNYTNGGSFSAFLIDWIEVNFKDQFDIIKQPFEDALNQI